MEIKRKWPLVLSSVVFLVVPVLILAAMTFAVSTGMLSEVAAEGNLEFSAFHVIFGYAIFGYPIFISGRYLIKKEKEGPVMHMLSCLVGFILFLAASKLLTSLGIQTSQGIAYILFAAGAVAAYFFHRRLKAYCTEGPIQSR